MSAYPIILLISRRKCFKS